MMLTNCLAIQILKYPLKVWTSYVDNPLGVIQRPNNSGMTPLHNAIKHRHSDVVEVLLEAGAKLTNDELHLAILDGDKSKGVVRLLIGAKAELNSADARGRSPLHCAVQKRSLDVVTGKLWNLSRFCSMMTSHRVDFVSTV